MLRDKIKGKKDFDTFIEEDNARINNFQDKLNKNEVAEERIPNIKYKIHDLRLGVLIAKYSRGDKLLDLIDEFKELLNQVPEFWEAEELMYTDELRMMSLGKLFCLNDMLGEIYIPLLEESNINDWLYNFILYEKNTDAPLLFPKPYQGVQDIVTTKDITKVAFLRNYLNKKWYKGHSDAGWYDTHKEPDYLYCGYWSWEAGAAAKILGLDDESLEEQQYYPYDLVHFKG